MTSTGGSRCGSGTRVQMTSCHNVASIYKFSDAHSKTYSTACAITQFCALRHAVCTHYLLPVAPVGSVEVTLTPDTRVQTHHGRVSKIRPTAARVHSRAHRVVIIRPALANHSGMHYSASVGWWQCVWGAVGAW